MWVMRVRHSHTRAVVPASRPVDVREPSHADPHYIGPLQEPLPTRNDAQTERLGDQPISPDYDSPEANRAASRAPTANAAPNAAPDALPPPPPSLPLGVSAPEQDSKEGGRPDQFALPSTAEAAIGSGKPAPSAADHVAMPEPATDGAAATEIPIADAANRGEPEALAAAGTPDAENQQLPPETSADRAEAHATTTEAESSSLETKSVTSAENDPTPARDADDGISCASLSDLIGPEVSPEEDEPRIVGESQSKALASVSETISKYRPRLGPRAAPPSRSTTAQKAQEQSAGTLEAVLLLSFLPGGWGISLAVLLGRADGMSENLEVRVGGTIYALLTIDDRLFEPFEPPVETDLVGSGFAAEATTLPTRRWVRTRRDLHVFSERPGVSGFASVPRALIGQENVILCRLHLADTATDCARATGSGELEHVAGPGIPEGWQCFRAFRPKAPADFGEASDIFLSLNPLPDAAIELSGGIASARSTWVVGAPPTIRILGSDPSAAEFTIDGHPATPAHGGDAWLAPGWDARGTHTIRFGGLSRTYEIVEVDEAWPTWATPNAGAYSACGAKVSTSAQLPAFAFPGEPRWLVGACAGDVAFANRSSAGIAIAAPSFRPVWALAARTTGRLLPATALPDHTPPQMPRGSVAREQIVQWCNLLRGSSAPMEASDKELWRQYRQIIRRLRRRGR